MKHHMSSYNHYVIMFIIMIVSGLLSTMNVWSDQWDDLRLSVNDVYMALLMAGWMLFFMGIVDYDPFIVILGLVIVIGSIWAIRTQFLVSERQYRLGMIPHHSMAIHMSKKLLEKENTLHDLLTTIIHTQRKEIIQLKQ